MGLLRDIGRALLRRDTAITYFEPKVRQASRGNGILLEANNLRVTHLRGLADGKDVTVVYRPRRSEAHNLEIATAVRNPIDTFSRKDGTSTAIEHFLAGKTVLVPSIEGFNDLRLVQALFYVNIRNA